MPYQLTDQKVRRSLECLRDNRRKTLTDLTKKYNDKYPPPLIGRLIGLKIDERNIQSIIDFLIGIGYVERHIMSFTDRPHLVPIIQYGLTNRGFQYLSSLK